MVMLKPCSFLASALLCLGLAGADAPDALRLKVLVVGAKGAVEDIAAPEWKLEVAGKSVKVASQRPPAEMGKAVQKWVFVLLPIRAPEYRSVALKAIATFMTGLPASDSVLVVLRTEKGLECLTPGFTTRPSLWAKALDTALETLPAKLKGRPEPTFSLPATPGAEPEESMAPVQAFLTKLAAKKLEKRADDGNDGRQSLTETYSPQDLVGHTITTARTLASLERLAEAVAKETGEKHLVLFSRNEMDDLANPVWSRAAQTADSRDTMNGKLQIELMMRDVILAQVALKQNLAQLGLDLHCVAAPAASYGGAFSDMALATGGNTYSFDADLPARMSQWLSLWALRYELNVTLPAGTGRPAKVSLDNPRKGTRMFAPSQR